MGNEQVKNQRETLRRRGYNRSIEEESSKKQQLQTLNQSLEHPYSAEPKQKYLSIDYSEDRSSIRSEKLKNKEEIERDQILHKLSAKNEELRKQLKKISEELTEQLKHKKFVPKKKKNTEE